MKKRKLRFLDKKLRVSSFLKKALILRYLVITGLLWPPVPLFHRGMTVDASIANCW